MTNFLTRYLLIGVLFHSVAMASNSDDCEVGFEPFGRLNISGKMVEYEYIRKNGASYKQLGGNDSVFVSFDSTGHSSISTGELRFDPVAMYGKGDLFLRATGELPGVIIRLNDESLRSAVAKDLEAGKLTRSLVCTGAICKVLNASGEFYLNGKAIKTFDPEKIWEKLLTGDIRNCSGKKIDVKMFIVGTEKPEDIISEIRKSVVLQRKKFSELGYGYSKKAMGTLLLAAILVGYFCH